MIKSGRHRSADFTGDLYEPLAEPHVVKRYPSTVHSVEYVIDPRLPEGPSRARPRTSTKIHTNRQFGARHLYSRLGTIIRVTSGAWNKGRKEREEW